jgi:hypothetical protein
MKIEQDGHDLTLTQVACPQATFETRLKLVLCPVRREDVPKIIDMTEQAE